MTRHYFVLAVVALGAAISASPTEAAVGRTAGQFSVSSNGSAQYTIPIWTPPGVRGVQPQLALAYNSNSGNGLLGIGWSLSGFSAVVRCNKTVAQDGVDGSPELDADDRFCLDGARLRSVTGAYGGNGATYQTEIANFAHVTSHGAAGSGPAWFEVKGRDGMTYQYGNTLDSAIVANGSSSVRVWALNAVIDPDGNKMTFLYNNDTTNGSYRPQSISYTFTASSPTVANYQVDLIYQSRPSADVLWSYEIGGKNDELNYLSRIDAKSWNGSAWVVKRSYTLNYQSAPTTSRMRIQTIQECDGASDCFPATTISYQDGQAGWGSEIANAGNMTNMAYALPIDLDGNGIDDLVYPDPSGSWYYVMGTASGTYQGPYSTGIANTNFAAALPIDFNADGKMDVLVPDASSNWQVLYFQSVGGTFTSVGTGVPAISTTQRLAAAADVDGDGRDDLVYAYEAGTGWGAARYIYYRLNTGSGFSAQNTLITYQTGGTTGPFIKWGTLDPFGSAASRFSSRRRLDFNKDGRDDFLFFLAQCSADLPGQCNSSSTSYTWQIILSQSNGSYLALDAIGFGYGSGSSTRPLTGDWNGDGCTDIAYPSSGTWRLRFGTCYRAGAGFSLSAAVNTGSTYHGYFGYALDWDGDGRDDIISPSSGSPQYWGYARSTGATMGTWTSLSIAYTSTVTMVADANGDGQSDLVYAASSALKTRLHSGATPDLATSFVDGFGITASPTYVYLTQSNYTKYNDASYPYQDYQGPMSVVSSLSASDGTGGTYTQSFQYYGAWLNLQGRGFSGFYAKRVHDSRNSLYGYTYYRRDFPYTGAMFQSDMKQADDSTLIGRTQNTFATANLETATYNQRYFPHIDVSTVTSYEVAAGNPIHNGRLVTTAVTNYTFDAYGNTTNVTTTVTDSDIYSPYAQLQWTSTTSSTITPDTGANWCLGLPTQTTVTNTAPGVPAIVRTVSFGRDYAKCRITSRTAEPSSGTYAVTEAFGFDGFGNVHSVGVTGAGVASRTTYISWGNGQFPVSITNPLGHVIGRGYDYSLGVQTSETDPNNITVGFQYDSFGRMRQEDRPDGTSTVWTINACPSSCPAPSDLRFWVQQQDRNTGAGVIREGRTSYDGFGRMRFVQDQILNGSYVYSAHRGYDALGRTVLDYVPSASESDSYHLISYDALNRPVSDGLYVNSALNRQSSIAYAGRSTTFTDAEGKSSTKIATVVGALGRSQDHNGYYQNFTYDAFGSLLAVSDSASNTLFSATYDYGISAFQRTTSDMDLGTRLHVFNALGEVTTGSDGKGQNFSMTHDALSRPLTRLESEGTTTWTWGNTAASRNIGRLQQVTSPGFSESYTYDTQGRLSNKQIVTDATYAYDYTYNSSTGLPDTMTYPTSTSSYRLKLQYHYQYGMLYRVQDYNSATIFWQANAMNARGQVTQELLGNGIITNRSYDPATGWLNNIQSGLGGGAGVQNESYLFDLVGNVTQRQNNNLGLTENFYYDNLHRLDYSTLGGNVNLDLSYDAMGNITSRSDVASGAAWTYHATKKHAVTQAGSGSYTYSYDANGNAITRNGYSITWSSSNYPTVINGPGKQLTFGYDANRQRIQQVYANGSTTETTAYVGGLLEKVTAASATDWRHYIRVGSRTVAVMSRSSSGTNVTRYILEDHQGSIANITDGSGASFVSESFTAFGARRDAATWNGGCNCEDLSKMKSVTRQGYTGHEAIGGVSMGLNHMNGRVQDAVTGRFLSPDPYVTEPGNTQGFNRYSYVNNNPLSFTDPSGFCTFLNAENYALVICNPVPFPDNPGMPTCNAFSGGLFCDPADFPSADPDPPCSGLLCGRPLPTCGLLCSIPDSPSTVPARRDDPPPNDRPISRTTVNAQVASAAGIGSGGGPVSTVGGTCVDGRGPCHTAPAPLPSEVQAAYRAASAVGDALGQAWDVLNRSTLVGPDGEPIPYYGGTVLTPGIGSVRNAATYVRLFGSHSALVRSLGPAGIGRQWHHVVEQTPGNVARFGAQAIHNTQNVVALEIGVHRQVSAFYSSVQPFTGGQTVRQWLSGQSLQQQTQFGLDTLRRFGVAP